MYKIDPGSGAQVSTFTIANGYAPSDLASCNYANTLAAQSSVDQRWSPSDQFGLAVTGGGVTYTGSLTAGGSAIQPSPWFEYAGGTIKAFTNVCTHQNTPIDRFDGARMICPQHGSQFDTNGTAVTGPASGALRSYAATTAGTTVTITLA